MNNNSTFISHFEITLEKGSASADFCTAFFTSEIYKNVPEEWWYQGGYITTDAGWIYAKHEATIDRGAKPKLNAADISSACSACKDSGCFIHWNIREN